MALGRADVRDAHLGQRPPGRTNRPGTRPHSHRIGRSLPRTPKHPTGQLGTDLGRRAIMQGPALGEARPVGDGARGRLLDAAPHPGRCLRPASWARLTIPGRGRWCAQARTDLRVRPAGVRPRPAGAARRGCRRADRWSDVRHPRRPAGGRARAGPQARAAESRVAWARGRGEHAFGPRRGTPPGARPGPRVAPDGSWSGGTVLSAAGRSPETRQRLGPGRPGHRRWPSPAATSRPHSRA